VPIWFALAQAYLNAGRDEDAIPWLHRVIESPAERTDWPIYYVRSFYLLGKIQESRGDEASALANYRRFLELWKDGDLDRGQVEEVNEKLRLLQQGASSLGD